MKTKETLYVHWQRPLISRANEALAHAFDISVGSELWKVKRCFHTEGKKVTPVYTETYFAKRLAITDNPPPENCLLNRYFEEILKCRFKVANTSLTIVTADQVIHSMMQCGLHIPLLLIQQSIQDKKGMLCVQYTYVNTQECNMIYESSELTLL